MFKRHVWPREGHSSSRTSLAQQQHNELGRTQLRTENGGVAGEGAMKADQNLRKWGLKLTRSGAAVWDTKPMTPKTRPKAIPRRTQENIAACAALGMSFWSEHPAPSTVWALDDDRVAHIIHLDRRRAVATHRCFGWRLWVGSSGAPCRRTPDSGTGGSANYVIPSTMIWTGESDA